MDTRTFDARTLRIRELNDALRAKFPRASAPSEKTLLTPAVAYAIREDELFGCALYDIIRRYCDFTDDNDPHGEHDMAFFECRGERVFWKIDYYDRACEYGSPDPADPAVTCRVLTIGLADDY